MAVANLSFYEEITKIAISDFLTGLYTKGYFQNQIHKNVEHACQSGASLSLLMIDIDHFKSFNDTYGHLKGDRLIAGVADILRENVDGSNIVARYGGEEFAVLLPEVSEARASDIGEKIRQAIASHRFVLGAGEPAKSATISVGVASLAGQWSSDELIERADQALYRAKNSGRNCVVAASASPVQLGFRLMGRRVEDVPR
jgi:diguanylate cyclase